MKPVSDFPTKSNSGLPPDAYSFDYNVQGTLWLTRSDLDLLILCARHHYDGVCQAMGLGRGEAPLRGAWRPERAGKLVVLRDTYLADDGERTPATLTSREIDTFLKILEQAEVLASFPAGASIELEHVCALRSRLLSVFYGIQQELGGLRTEGKNHSFSP